MIEMMAVVAIIVLLFTMLIPAIRAIHTRIMATASKGTIGLLSSACDMFSHDWDDQYPPSQMTGYTTTGGRNMYGRELLALFLTGYGPDAGTKGLPLDGGATYLLDDGLDGWGMRREQAGRKLGPYNGAENVKMHKVTSGTAVGELCFVDSFGNDIYYYRYGGAQYNSDNSDGPIESLGQNYVKDPDDSTNPYLSTRFILASPGADATWTAYFGDKATDDITNFIPEQQ
ncbi:MAG: type II secretion system protein [Phycisphaerae bacterium]